MATGRRGRSGRSPPTCYLDRRSAYEGVPNVRTAVLNVLDKAAIQSLVATLPPLHVLFNCAGFVHNGSILQATDDDWDFAFNLNVRAQYWMIQARAARHAGRRRRQHHQHGQRLQQPQGPAQPLHLRQQQGGGGGTDAAR